MADETTIDEKPAPLTIVPQDEPETESAAEASTHDRLRAFEDEHLGPDVERLNGHIERGSGSRFSSLKARERAHHAALEHLIKAEEKHAAANSAMSAADAELAAAQARVDATAEPAQEAKAEREQGVA